jgi:hypothetical protein
VVTALVFSFMQGIFHAYYTVALAPAVGALVGIGSVFLWRRRAQFWARTTLAATLSVTAMWAYTLLARSPDWHPWLATLVLVAGLAAAGGLLAAHRLAARAGVVIAGVALAVALAGPAAYALQTASEPHTGAIPSAGPAVTGGGLGPGGLGFGPGGAPGGAPGRQNGTGAGPGGFGGPGGLPGGAAPGGGNGPGGAAAPGGAGSAGGLLQGSSPAAELVAVLSSDADRYTWVAAAVGANNAAGYQLATDEPVMAIGGFNGSDPSPTLAQFQQYVAEGRIHYFIGGGMGAGPGGGASGGSNASAEIAQWVAENFEAATIGGVTLYDLSSASPA